MGLEATMIVLDNSEWMRNGDYTPSRVAAQQDAANMLFNAKTQGNPESAVGLMTMAGKSPEVQVTLTRELGKLVTALNKIKVAGAPDISTGIQIAQLALKHRKNKNQHQRIIVFVGSPLEEDEKALVRIGKKLKKNNVALDVVNFGEETENTRKLEAFVSSVNSNDNSHLVTVPPGPHILSDVLISSPILAGDGVVPSFGAGGEPYDEEMELAMRLSLAEEAARRERESGGAAGAADAQTAAPNLGRSGPASFAMDFGIDDPELAAALALSMQDAQPASQESNSMDVDSLTEEEQYARALAMSMEQDAQPASSQGISAALQDPAQLASILGSLPGVDPNDPLLRNTLQGNPSSDNKDKKEEEEKK